MLEVECAAGCHDRAVIGGLDAFLDRPAGQSAELQELALRLAPARYHELSPAARATWLKTEIARLTGYAAAAPAGAPAPAQPAATPEPAAGRARRRRRPRLPQRRRSRTPGSGSAVTRSPATRRSVSRPSTTCSSTTRSATATSRPRAASVSSWSARREPSAAWSCPSPPSALARPHARRLQGRGTRRLRQHAGRHLVQPALARNAPAEGLRNRPRRQGRLQRPPRRGYDGEPGVLPVRRPRGVSRPPRAGLPQHPGPLPDQAPAPHREGDRALRRGDRRALAGRSARAPQADRAAPGLPRDPQPPELRRAERRLAFDELLGVQLAVVRRKRRLAQAGLAPAIAEPDTVRGFLESLPFGLTAAQRRSLTEIEGEIASTTPMARLLQGDVGSGKTVVGPGGDAGLREQRQPGRAHGADGGARGAALPHDRHLARHRPQPAPASGSPICRT